VLKILRTGMDDILQLKALFVKEVISLSQNPDSFVDSDQLMVVQIFGCTQFQVGNIHGPQITPKDYRTS